MDDHDADGDGGGYRWEAGYEKTWEAVREDEHGSLEASIMDIINKAKRKRMLDRQGTRRLGMMRHLVMILDLSKSMEANDLPPSRQEVAVRILQGFVDEFLDQNPVGQLGLIVTKDKRADKLSDLSGNARKQKDALEKAGHSPCGGEISLQNALETAHVVLKNIPAHSSREILVIMGGMTTCDAGNINITIDKLKMSRIRISVIGLSAEVHICKKMTSDTKGDYGVILSEPHFKELVSAHSLPPVTEKEYESSLIKMGFPLHKSYEVGGESSTANRNPDDIVGNGASVDASASSSSVPPSMCICHAEHEHRHFTTAGYFCPQCQAKYCEIPVECKICGLTLVSAPHLARSYRHLFPLPPFDEEVVTGGGDGVVSCPSCLHPIAFKGYRCKDCSLLFCVDCDVFIHETLHTCPGCSS